MPARVAFWNLDNVLAVEGYPGRPPWIAETLQKDLKGWSLSPFDRMVAQLASMNLKKAFERGWCG